MKRWCPVLSPFSLICLLVSVSLRDPICRQQHLCRATLLMPSTACSITSLRENQSSKIVKWEDFDSTSLMKCCGGLFYEMLKHAIEPMKFPHLENDIIRFADEAALEKHYISQWIHPIDSKCSNVHPCVACSNDTP